MAGLRFNIDCVQCLFQGFESGGQIQKITILFSFVYEKQSNEIYLLIYNK